MSNEAYNNYSFFLNKCYVIQNGSFLSTFNSNNIIVLLSLIMSSFFIDHKISKYSTMKIDELVSRFGSVRFDYDFTFESNRF